MKPLLSKHLSKTEQERFKKDIILLQNTLRKKGYKIAVDGLFGPGTDAAVKQFQDSVSGLTADGWVGQMTWAALLTDKPIDVKNEPIGIPTTDYFLEDDEYYKDIHEKDTVWIHHTAGGGNAYFVTQSWEHDKKRNGDSLKVGTAFIIARKSRSRNPEFNCEEGELFRAFDEKYWCHHLGLSHKNNVDLNARSIGIEICSYGQLTLNKKGNFTTIYGNVIDPDEVYDHGKEFRGYRYWHKYSDEQLETLRKLLIELREKFGLKYQDSFDASWSDYNPNLFNPTPGIWTHTNVRKDKFDCFPQPELLEILNSL